MSGPSVEQVITFVLYVLALVLTGLAGFSAAFGVIMTIGLIETPHNATVENIIWTVMAFAIAFAAFLVTEWLSE